MTTYYTKDQAERIIADWGIAQPLPRKGMQVGVQWAGESSRTIAQLRLRSRSPHTGTRYINFNLRIEARRNYANAI